MKQMLKIVIFLSIVILVLSSIFVIFPCCQETNNFEDERSDDGAEGFDGYNSDNDNWNSSDENSDDGSNGRDQQYIHTVFIEEGTAGWCSSCPAVADTLHELYKSENKDYQFYYVSLIHDENDKAKQRLVEDYTIYGFPTVIIDGGYKVIIGEQDKSVFEAKISAASLRKVPKLHIEVNAEWDENTEEIETNVFVENRENEPYAGRLKVYLTERNSRWSDVDGNPYHFGFLDYIIDEEIMVSAKGNASVLEVWSASELDPDNLMIIAVVFNSESTKYSYPPDGNNDFDAHYADATDATEVIEAGNLPPELGIQSPRKKRLHIFGNSIGMTPFRENTILLGRTTIEAYVADDSGIEKVEFYINGRLKEFNATIYEKPYEWTWHKLAFGKYTITVKAYDNQGKTSTASIDVIAFIL